MSCLLSACHICSCSITSKTRLLSGVFCESFCSTFVFFPCLFFNIRCVYAAFFFFCICCSAFPLSTLPEHFEPSCSVMQNHLLLKAHVIFPLLLECYWKEVACSSTALSHHCPLLQGFNNNIDEDWMPVEIRSLCGSFPQCNLKLRDCLSIIHQNLQPGVIVVVHRNICTTHIKTRVPRNLIREDQDTF